MTKETSQSNRRFWKDLWQLHIPLVVVLAICGYATYIEVGRAAQGVDRAIVYSIQWPLIGVFAIVVWNRYRKHGSLTKSLAKYFRERTSRISQEAERFEKGLTERMEPEPLDSSDLAQKAAWDEYVAELHRVDPPGGPPDSKT